MTQQEFTALLKMFESYEQTNKEAHGSILRKIEDLCRSLHEHEAKEERQSIDCRTAVMQAIADAKAGAVAEATKPSPYKLVVTGLWSGALRLLGVASLGAGIAVAIMKLAGAS